MRSKKGKRKVPAGALEQDRWDDLFINGALLRLVCQRDWCICRCCRACHRTARSPASNHRPHHAGYLHKKSTKGKNQKRWFKTSPKYLVYYSTDKEEQVLKAIALDPQVLTIEVTPGDDTTFALSGGEGGTVELKASSGSDAARWVRKLSARLARIRAEETARPLTRGSSGRIDVGSLSPGRGQAEDQQQMGPLKIKLNGPLGTHPWETRFFAIEPADRRAKFKRRRRATSAIAYALRWYRRREHMDASNNLHMGARKSTVSIEDLRAATGGGGAATGGSALDSGGIDGEMMLSDATLTIIMGGSHNFTFEIASHSSGGRIGAVLQLRAVSTQMLRSWTTALEQCGVPSERSKTSNLTAAQKQKRMPKTTNAVKLAVSTVAGNALEALAEGTADSDSAEDAAVRPSSRTALRDAEEVAAEGADGDFNPEADRAPVGERFAEAHRSLRGIEHTLVDDDALESEDSRSRSRSASSPRAVGGGGGGGGGSGSSGSALDAVAGGPPPLPRKGWQARPKADAAAVPSGFSDDESDEICAVRGGVADGPGGGGGDDGAELGVRSPGPAPPFIALQGTKVSQPKLVTGSRSKVSYTFVYR